MNEGANLREALIDNQVPVASSCSGEAVCGKCFIKILSGSESLSTPTTEELKLALKNNLSQDSRISCITFVNGNITIDTPYW